MRKSFIVLSAVTLASCAVSAWLWTEFHAERARNNLLAARLATVEAASATPRTVTDAQSRPPRASPAVATHTAADSAELISPFAVPEQDDWLATQRRLLRDPDYRHAWWEQARLARAARRNEMVRVLGLTPAQADAVTDITIERQLKALERTIPNPVTEEYQRQLQVSDEAEERAYDARLRELLGQEKSAQLKTYVESRPSRNQVERLRADLIDTDVLRDDQVEPLIAALHVEQSQMQRELEERVAAMSETDQSEASQRKFLEYQAGLIRETDRRMHTAAAAILSATQLQKLDAMLKRDFETHEAQQRMSRIESKLEEPGSESAKTD